MTSLKIAPIGFRILPVLLTAVFFAAPLAAAPSPEAEDPERPAIEAEPVEVDTSAMRVVIDPRTGEVVSNQIHENRALSEALAHALSRSTEGLEAFDLTAGGVGVHLEGRFQHVMTVKVRVDGSFELECTDSARKAKDVLHGKTEESVDASRVR